MDDKKWDELKKRWAEKDVTFKKPNEKAAANFGRDLKRGQKAEHDFWQKYSKHLTRTDGRKGDFIVNKTDEILELKTDFHNPKQTPNIFIERHSYNGEPGGPWQAKEHGATYYAYWMPNGPLLMLFNVNDLLKRMRKLEPSLKKHFIKNTNHVTTGYLVERELLEDLCLDPEEVIMNGVSK